MCVCVWVCENIVLCWFCTFIWLPRCYVSKGFCLCGSWFCRCVCVWKDVWVDEFGKLRFFSFQMSRSQKRWYDTIEEECSRFICRIYIIEYNLLGSWSWAGKGDGALCLFCVTCKTWWNNDVVEFRAQNIHIIASHIAGYHIYSGYGFHNPSCQTTKVLWCSLLFTLPSIRTPWLWCAHFTSHLPETDLIAFGFG